MGAKIIKKLSIGKPPRFFLSPESPKQSAQQPTYATTPNPPYILRGGLPHRGYTFDSAGLASVTQPTLGNSASEDTTPLGGCTFSHHTSLPHAANGLFANDFPIRKLIKKVQCRWHRFLSTTLPRVDFAALNQPWADKSTTPMVLVHVHRFPNKQNHTRNPPKRNRRGGACVPARTSAQRRFHTKIYLRITYHARGFNDGCALVGRHGRAHRHRPYQTPSCFFAPFH